VTKSFPNSVLFSLNNQFEKKKRRFPALTGIMSASSDIRQASMQLVRARQGTIEVKGVVSRQKGKLLTKNDPYMNL